MAAGYDGSIRINTKIDTNGMEQGVKHISKDFAKAMAGIKKTTAEIDILEKKMAGLKEKQDAKIEVTLSGMKEAETELKTLTEKKRGMEIAVEENYSGLPFRSSAGKETAVQESLFRDKEYVRLLDAIDKAENAVVSYRKELTAARAVEKEPVETTAEYRKLAAQLDALRVRQEQYIIAAKKATAAANPSAITKVKKSFNALGSSVVGLNKKAVPFLGQMLRLKTVFIGVAMAQAAMGGLRAIKEGMQNVAQYSRETNGTISSLLSGLAQLKNGVAAAAAPLLNALGPALNYIIGKLNSAVTAIGSFFAALTGKKTVLKAVKVQQDYAASLNETTAAAEKTKDVLASFDEIEVLDTSPQTPSAPAASSGGNVGDMFEEVEIDDKTLSLVEKLKKMLGEMNIDYLKDSWDQLKQSWKDFTESKAFEVIKKVLEEIVKLLGENVFHILGDILKLIAYCLDYWTALSEGDWAGAINAAKNAFLDILDIIVRVPLTIIDAVFGTDFTQRWDEFIKKTKEFDLGQWFKDIFDEIKNYYPEKMEELKKAWDDLKTEVLKKFDNMKIGFKNFWDEIVKYYPQKIEEMKKAWADLKQDFSEKISSMKTSIATTMGEMKKVITEKWGDIKKWFESTVAPKFTKKFWSDKFDGIKQGAKSVLNGIISIVEKAVNGIIAKLNTLHWSIPDWVPGVGGKSFGFDIQQISIPRLATGAIIPPNQEFLAVLGDQKSGRNLEAPEGLIRQIMREELAGLMGGGEVNVNIEFSGSLAQLARVLHPAITKEQKRIGGTLQTGGVL